jgi:DNA-binding MarR family transcriptional regulator
MLIANKLGALGVLLSDALEKTNDDLSPSAAALLLTLFYGPDVTSTAAAKVAGVRQPTAVRIVDGLARRGLIQRNERAGRITRLTVTLEGRKRARSLQMTRLGAMADILHALSKRERATFGQVLDKLLRAATHSRAFARTTCRLCDHKLCTGALCPIGTRATELEREPKM